MTRHSTFPDAPAQCARHRRSALALLVAALLLSLFSATMSPVASAHPEDEFCVPGEGGLDPALCRALNELDSASMGPGANLSPLLDETGEVRGFWDTAGLYVGIGVGHILPGGLDHILFVLALFLTSPRLRPLIIQISAFTIAHTVTLALAASGVIAPPASIVEPLIALTIAFVAVENVVFRDMTRWRPLVVFGFGLIHGMGFAGFFGELGLPPGQFWSALIGFNVGVEIGQLACVLAAAVVAWVLRKALARVGKDRWYRLGFVIPASAAIALTGLWWGIERIFFSA